MSTSLKQLISFCTREGPWRYLQEVNNTMARGYVGACHDLPQLIGEVILSSSAPKILAVGSEFVPQADDFSSGFPVEPLSHVDKNHLEEYELKPFRKHWQEKSTRTHQFVTNSGPRGGWCYIPPSHPLHALSRKAASRYVKHHRSPLHHLFFTTKVIPNNVETVDVFRRHPNYIPSFSSHMKGSRAEALIEANSNHTNSPVSVYSDGSGFEGGVGASAVLFINGVETKSLRYHLGSIKEHTVYEAEIVGLTLSLHLLSSLRRQLRHTTILGTDCQAIIQALDNQRPHPAHCLLDHVHNAAERLQVKQDKLRNKKARRDAKNRGEVWSARTRGVIDLQLHWTPSHVNFLPNDRADEEAKIAAQGLSSNKDGLPPYLHTKETPLGRYICDAPKEPIRPA